MPLLFVADNDLAFRGGLCLPAHCNAVGPHAAYLLTAASVARRNWLTFFARIEDLCDVGLYQDEDTALPSTTEVEI